MTGPPCGRPDCPVPDHPPVHVRTFVIEAGTVLHRGHMTHHPDPADLVPGLGDTRFAPLPGTHHVYVATTAIGALLESALHDAAPPAPRIREGQLARWSEGEVTLTDVRLIDLRDAELARLGITRDAVVATSAEHYLCTRRWALPLRGRVVGGQQTHGLLWTSRQAELHADAVADRPAFHDLLDEHPTHVAVLWTDPGAATPLRATGHGLGPLAAGPGHDYVEDLADMLHVTIFD